MEMQTEPEKTIDSFDVNHDTYYLDLMPDGTFNISKDEITIEPGLEEKDAKEYFAVLRAYYSLKIGEAYWIQAGSGHAVQGVLTEFFNGKRTALFGEIARKVTSVYLTKEEAENGQY